MSIAPSSLLESGTVALRTLAPIWVLQCTRLDATATANRALRDRRLRRNRRLRWRRLQDIRRPNNEPAARQRSIEVGWNVQGDHVRRCRAIHDDAKPRKHHLLGSHFTPG